MAIKGSLKEASLPDVLQLLAMGKKTGCLSVTHRSNFGYIYFDKGRISYASIVNRRDRLGDMLVKNGVISVEELEVAVMAQGKRRRKLACGTRSTTISRTCSSARADTLRRRHAWKRRSNAAAPTTHACKRRSAWWR
jgi:hypothetical protein